MDEPADTRQSLRLTWYESEKEETTAKTRANRIHESLHDTTKHQTKYTEIYAACK